MTPDPKPAKRIKNPLVFKLLYLRPGTCSVCGEGNATLHHVVPKKPHGGDDVEENLVWLCGTGTTGCHGKVEHHDGPTRLALGQHIKARRPDVVDYVGRKFPLEADWLRRTYMEGSD